MNLERKNLTRFSNCWNCKIETLLSVYMPKSKFKC